jgi:hypothetical protein
MVPVNPACRLFRVTVAKVPRRGEVTRALGLVGFVASPVLPMGLTSTALLMAVGNSEGVGHRAAKQNIGNTKLIS